MLKPFSLFRLILIIVLLFAATLTTAFAVLLVIGDNQSGFPFAWKTVVPQGSVFQVFGFIIDVVFLILAGLTTLLRRLKRNNKRTKYG